LSIVVGGGEYSTQSSGVRIDSQFAVHMVGVNAD
jgi:hypothetical protein